jgi:hypothetical protein
VRGRAYTKAAAGEPYAVCVLAAILVHEMAHLEGKDNARRSRRNAAGFTRSCGQVTSPWTWRSSTCRTSGKSVNNCPIGGGSAARGQPCKKTERLRSISTDAVAALRGPQGRPELCRRAVGGWCR